MPIAYKQKEWLIPAGLLLLSTVPVIAGAVRIGQLSSGAEITPENARFFAAPLPVIIHIVSITIYSLLGAFQFVPTFRRQRRGWHRAAGRVLIPSGLAATLSGLWMTQFYPWPEGDGVILYLVRLVVGAFMLMSLLWGSAAIWRRDFAQHGNWMLRAYAIGMGAGTQVLTHLPWVLFLGKPDELTRAGLMAAGWLINWSVAEWIISRRTAALSPPPYMNVQAIGVQKHFQQGQPLP